MLTKIKLIEEKPLLVRFTLATEETLINCIITKEILSRQIMMLPDDKYTVAVKGHFNKTNQLVVQELRILDKDEFTNRLGI
ncbi:hypothetical protein [Enterococcus gilvus]|uniref:Uncharacterized protein n=1 Tax=Enterococcus gilvus ATCC BAA-350 TaxID=1158614 RepID=R2VI58_9ENTE|nr:hypothetical protein [Enterococcus gilvus]EOI57500.1 hypothetical protein UKC_01719 [Enterococcus gilvus ATCC BAA-350]EOW82926.1 hypothetical protein I592_02248 [Enterococcus gilvus ATCC BAA-350]